MSMTAGALTLLPMYLASILTMPACLPAWALSSPAVSSTIVGTTSPEQFAGSVKAADIELSDEERQQISDYFDTDVKEEGLQLFPGTKYNFPRLRRALFLATRE